ncbi:MAG: HD domain-containing protein [Hyphomicrobiales bacterium]|nr:HD domain-containing protein [Hyphomicrobiales bacterium]
MTQWGLSAELRDQAPWDLPPELLGPGKVVTDPVHRDIHLTELEVRLLNSRPLQRLRRVRQLGTSNLVYPGATHSRLSHSLGALHVAQRILDVVEAQRSGPYPTKDLFGEWADAAEVDFPYERKLAEAIVLGRVGGLLHDLCHIPFGHTLEDDLGLLSAHDENEVRFETLWQQFPADVREPMESGGLREALKPLILSKADPLQQQDTHETLPPFRDRQPADRYPFIRDVVGNTICADLIDYLQRDHYMAGLPASLGHRFLDGFYVAPSGIWCEERMVMRIARNGRERADIVTELFKYLRYRYEETERVLVHHAKLGADAMIGKLLSMWADELLIEELRSAGADLDDVTAKDIDVSIGKAGSDTSRAARARVGERVEGLFLNRGDDGVLEYIVDLYEDPATSRQAGVKELALAVLDRRLYKLIGRAPETAGLDRATFFNTYGDPAKKREIEQRVSVFAGIDEGWRVLLWVPPPAMRLKPADVLVTSDGRTVQRLRDHERHGQQGAQISDNHRNLWAVSVYVDRAVADDRPLCDAMLAELSREMGGLHWERPEGIGDDAEAVVAVQIANSQRLSPEQEMYLVDSLRRRQAAALTRRRSGEEQVEPVADRTYRNLYEEATAIADAQLATDAPVTRVDAEVDAVDEEENSLFTTRPDSEE